MATQTPTRTIRSIDDVPGWFGLTDQLVMDWLLRHQARAGVTGDLLEMGAYLGKSTILVGSHRRQGERFVVCDLFGQEPPTEDNQRTAAYYTENLTRSAFEANYAAFHSEAPDVIQAPTSVLPDHIEAGSCRFAHIDACHLFDVVLEDIATARAALNDDGIVVFDDIRAAHTPGVPAAVWPEVASGGLRPICITPNKLYATWGDPERMQDEMLGWLREQQGADFEPQQVAGGLLIVVGNWTEAPPSPMPSPRDAAPAARRGLDPRLKRIAYDLLPPIVSRTIHRLRHR